MVSAPVIEELKSEYARRKGEIRAQLGEFKQVRAEGDDRKIFEEMAFCILTSAVGPRVGQKSLEAIKDILPDGSAEETESRLRGIHKYPEKAYYIAHTRDYLKSEYGFKLRELVNSFDDPEERRDFFALNKNIKGLGFTQASHFLRNIGFTGYAILDKNVVRSLYDLGVIESPKPPSTKKKYMETESKMKIFAGELGIDVEELDMLLWSMKTGKIPV
jgi:N-glycosylase/DNA lyase